MFILSLLFLFSFFFSLSCASLSPLSYIILVSIPKMQQEERGQKERSGLLEELYLRMHRFIEEYAGKYTVNNRWKMIL